MKRHVESDLPSQEQSLVKRGWVRGGVYPWIWTHPRYPAAHYTLHDALQVAGEVEKDARQRHRRAP